MHGPQTCHFLGRRWSKKKMKMGSREVMSDDDGVDVLMMLCSFVISIMLF